MFKSLSLKVILFGFIFTFFSSFGQSFFIGLFNNSIRSELSISHGQFGSIYASATLLSSLVLIWIGKKIDDMSAFKFSLFVIVLFSFASYFFSTIKIVPLLFVGIFLLRLSGQGLMSHTSSTTVSRYFDKTRGRALSISWFGLSTAEFILPVLVTYFFLIYSWRTVWQGIAILIILLLPFVIISTIKSVSLDSRETDTNPKNKKIKIKSWRRREVIKDYRFYIVSLNMLAMPWLATGTFVYQSFISDSKMWAIYTIPKAFMIYSITSIATLFLSGFLVDKFTGRKLILIMNIPLLLAMYVLFKFNNEIFAYIFLGLVGASNGLRAADLTNFGITGTPKSLHNVFVENFGARVNADCLVPEPEFEWAVMQSYHKQFACCQYSHSAIEAVLKILSKMGPEPNYKAIEKIKLKTHWRGKLLSNLEPKTTLAAKFSMEHILATSIYHGSANVEAFNLETLSNQDIKELRNKVDMYLYDPEPISPNDRPAEVSIQLSDGKKYTHECLIAEGSASKPFTNQTIKNKINQKNHSQILRKCGSSGLKREIVFCKQ